MSIKQADMSVQWRYSPITQIIQLVLIRDGNEVGFVNFSIDQAIAMMDGLKKAITEARPHQLIIPGVN